MIPGRWGVLLFVLCAFLNAPNADAAGALAVLPIRDAPREVRPEGFEAFLEKAARVALPKDWTIFSADDVRLTMAKAELRPDPCNDLPQCFLWPAGKLGARFVTYVSLQSADAELIATFHLVDTRFGSVLSSETIRGTASDITVRFQSLAPQFFGAVKDVSEKIGASATSDGEPLHRPLSPGVPNRDGEVTEMVGRIVRRHWNAIKYCTQNGVFASHPRVLVQFEVGPNGDVTQASLPESHLPPETAACILENVRRWKFAEPPRGEPITVNYPFVFE